MIVPDWKDVCRNGRDNVIWSGRRSCIVIGEVSLAFGIKNNGFRYRIPESRVFGRKTPSTMKVVGVFIRTECEYPLIVPVSC